MPARAWRKPRQHAAAPEGQKPRGGDVEILFAPDGTEVSCRSSRFPSSSSPPSSTPPGICSPSAPPPRVCPPRLSAVDDLASGLRRSALELAGGRLPRAERLHSSGL